MIKIYSIREHLGTDKSFMLYKKIEKNCNIFAG